MEGSVDAGRQRVLDELALAGKTAFDKLPVPSRSAPLLFSHLIRYRIEAERVVRATRGWMMCGDPVLRGMLVEQLRIGAKLTTLLGDVDRWLCALMDPQDRTFELRELIARYGWPDVDLADLEADEF
ncbi:hypothetical protein [Sorangium sp. So ce145]|uniref:hypothetical protein n=1 Tax=Sorangium sp. So ce145 TaxID=3133285 RepID=UPI003F5E4DC2